MSKNMGTADRLIRASLVALIAILYFTGTITGTVATVLGIVAGVLLLTSLLGWCPVYFPFGLSTCKTQTKG